jgi:hypothetical protein
MALSEADRAELSDIGWHWGGSYYVRHDGETYTATRKGYPDRKLTASALSELREMIKKDYLGWLGELRGEAMST